VSKRRQWRKRYSDVIGQAKNTVWPAVPKLGARPESVAYWKRLFQHPPAAILHYHFAQTTFFFQISNTKK